MTEYSSSEDLVQIIVEEKWGANLIRATKAGPWHYAVLMTFEVGEQYRRNM